MMKKNILLAVFLTFFLATPTFVLADTIKKFTVVLDAGHGGHDPGNLGSGYKEKDIALKIVLAIGRILERDASIKVLYTRKTDKFVDLYDRADIANKAKADLFVSVHCNAHHTKASGTETFVLGLHGNSANFEVAQKENSVIYLEDNYKERYAGYDINSPESFIGVTLMQEEFLSQSISLAKTIQDKFSKKLKRKNRGVKQAGFIVLHQTFMPSVLVETGFLTYKKEGAYLHSKKGQNAIASAVADAVVRYKRQIQANTAVSNTFATKKRNIVYKVQIASSVKKIETKPYNFKGFSPISYAKVGRIYEYFYGQTPDYQKAKKLREKARRKGYTSSYIVAYLNGKKISVRQALQTK